MVQSAAGVHQQIVEAKHHQKQKAGYAPPVQGGGPAVGKIVGKHKLDKLFHGRWAGRGLALFFEKYLVKVHAALFVIAFLYKLAVAMHIHMKVSIQFQNALENPCLAFNR